MFHSKKSYIQLCIFQSASNFKCVLQFIHIKIIVLYVIKTIKKSGIWNLSSESSEFLAEAVNFNVFNLKNSACCESYSLIPFPFAQLY